MTQSGQGEEPSARPAHEGIVLPSDGGEPLLPGMTGAPAPSAPPGGQAWGGAWGPGQEQRPPQEQSWPPAADDRWHTPEQPGGPGPMPPEGPAPAAYDQGYPQQYQGGEQPGGYQNGYQDPDGHGGYQGSDGQNGYGQQGYQTSGGYPGEQQPGAYPAAGAPMPPMHEAATQYMPPVPGAPGNEGATQYLPPVPAGGDEAATQYIPPVAAGSLPPEAAGQDPRQQGHGQQPGRPDAEAATQYIPPYQGDGDGDRRPPAEFDNLFRGREVPVEGSTQQMPRVPGGPGPAPVVSAQPAYRPPMDDEDGGRRGNGRTGSRWPLIAAIGVGIVVIGLGAGALLSGGGDDKGGESAPAASASAGAQSSAEGTDAGKQQAVELDKVLADSGNSRAAVIQSVGNVKACRDLGKAATDLRDAARQRGDLVTRLGKLSVDQLPDNASLKSALTKAWQASAAADNHYAAWADQVGAQRGCPKGHARVTNHAQVGNRESGTASEQKAKASQLWNAIAQKYSLTQRQPTQL